MSIPIEYIEAIKKVVNEICPNRRTPKYSVEYYIENFIYVLRDVVSWKLLRLLHKDKDKYHYKTIADKFLEWSNKGVFEKAYTYLLNKYPNPCVKWLPSLNLFIDSSYINNKSGSELINYGQNPKKKVTKLSVISDSSGQVYSSTLYDGKVHDSKTIEKSVEDLTKKSIYRSINLIGDKGYHMKLENKRKVLDKKITLVVPQKKNQKIRTSEAAKKLLKNRYTIENTIQTIKKYNRIDIRRDRLMITYKSFVYLALLLNFICKYK